MTDTTKKFGEGLALDKCVAKVSCNMQDPLRKSVPDKSEQDKVIAENGMADNAFRCTKQIVDTQSVAVYRAPFTKLREFYTKNTLPIGDGKQPYRLVSVKHLRKFQQQLNELENEAKDGRDKFLRQYQEPEWLEGQKARMGEKFNEKDYPKYEDIKDKFNVDTNIEPFAGDENIEKMRFFLDTESMENIRKSFDSQNAKIKHFATQSVWEDLVKQLSKLSQVCASEAGSGKGSIFRETLVPNVKDILDRIPALNFDGDETLEEIRKEATSMLNDVTSSDLRKDTKKREQVGKTSKSVLDKVKSYNPKAITGKVA